MAPRIQPIRGRLLGYLTLILQLVAAIVVLSSLAHHQARQQQAQHTASVLQLLAGELGDGDSTAAATRPISQSAQQFAAAPAPVPSSPDAAAAAAVTVPHRSSSNGTYRFSHVLQFHIPQLWDTVNMSQIVKDNLEPDLQWWRLSPYEPLVEDLFATAKHHPEFATLTSVRQLVEIFNNTLRFPLMPPEQQYSCGYWCDPQLEAFVHAMHDAVHMYNLTLPNVLFLINTADSPCCSRDQVATRECRAPVISLSKQQHIADLVGPVMRAEDARVVHRSWPWEQKAGKAFFRGVPSCGEMTFEPHLCARTWVARLASTNYSHLLDAGLVEEYGSPDQMKGDAVLREGGPLPVLPRVHMTELPKFKWLLNLDGHVAAYRLAQLLATNSLVLKQQSFFSEFYYKSLRPYHHFVPIFKHSQHDLIPKLAWAASHDDLARRITRNANHFALTYTTYRARVLYWRYLLMGYSRLVPDMAEYFEKRAAEQRGT